MLFARPMRYYVTTPVYYVNDNPHIGHAYSSLIADVLTRALRLVGHEVRFTTGTDEHGQKVQNTAKKHGKCETDFVDHVSKRFRDLCVAMHYDFSDFIRTTETRHKDAVQALWSILSRNEFIFLDEYSGWYSERDEAFYTEAELQNGLAPTGAPVSWTKEACYFFKLSQFSELLKKFYAENPTFIQPKSRFNEMLAFLKAGMHDLSISRTRVQWGINVPDDPTHTVYVWLDALTNYISSVGYPDTSTDSLFSAFWDNARVIHIIGKDILRFHSIYWPAFLMAANLKTPDVILAHGWWLNDGEKISKSLGNIIDPFELISEFGVDPIRYFLIREITVGKDGNFNTASLIERINSELADNIGNLLHRTLTLTVRLLGPKVSEIYESENELLEFAYSLAKGYKNDIELLDLNSSLDRIIQLSSKANEYISTEEPWKLKENPEKAGRILYSVLEALRIIAIGLQPFIPQSASTMLDLLAVPSGERKLANMNRESRVKPGTQITLPVSPLFKKHR
ncbi:methionine--tRNA ligase [Neorickettsia sp. 179522]|uniref:methionine--tRNA ligase n=1 Tax=Neorickettsia sp. 179522 TaxID=1714371 RepID=UPI0006072997|nr:methionine--tRNA ligase [Neorickettsia sp. 179522]